MLGTRTSNKSKNTLILLILFSTNFFNCVIIPNKLNVIAILIFIHYAIKNRHCYGYSKKAIVLYFVFLFMSCLSSWLNRGQDLMYTFSTDNFINQCSLLIYFYLLGTNLKSKDIEDVLYRLVIIFCLCYLIQYFVYPIKLFRYNDVASQYSRIKIDGQILCSIGFCLSLQKFLRTSKIKHLILFFVTVLIFVMLGYRMLLLLLLLPFFYLIIRNGVFNRTTIFLVTISIPFILFFSYTDVFQSRVSEFIAKNKSDAFGNDEYIRLLELDFYLKDHFKNIYEIIFGTGFPSIHSEYGQDYIYILDTQYEKGMNYVRSGWVDLGLLGFACIIGPISVIILIITIIRNLLLQQSSDRVYLKAIYLFLLPASLLSIELFRIGSFVYNGLLFYLMEKSKD